MGGVQILVPRQLTQRTNRETIRQKGQEKDWQMMLRLRSPRRPDSPCRLYLAIG